MFIVGVGLDREGTGGRWTVALWESWGRNTVAR